MTEFWKRKVSKHFVKCAYVTKNSVYTKKSLLLEETVLCLCEIEKQLERQFDYSRR